MKPLKQIIFFTGALLGAVSCSSHLSDRVKEQLYVQKGSFNKLRAKNLVRESLQHPSTRFALTIEPKIGMDGVSVQILEAKGISIGERMIFAIIDPLKDQIQPEFEFEYLADGQVKVYSRHGIYITDQIPFLAAEGIMPGVPIQYVITSVHRKTSAIAIFNPKPLEIVSTDGKTLFLTASHPLKTRFLLTGSGFDPGETVPIEHRLGAQIQEIELIADEEGKIETELLPYQIGLLGGTAQVKMNDLELTYPWGGQLEKGSLKTKESYPVLFVVNQDSKYLDLLETKKIFAKGSE